jgi:hypothetical protein
MSLTDDFLKELKKKKKRTTEKTKQSGDLTSDFLNALAEIEKERQYAASSLVAEEDDIAPVRGEKSSSRESLLKANSNMRSDNPAAYAGMELGKKIGDVFSDESIWSGWFKKGNDDVSKTILGTTTDASTDFATGAVGLGEKIVDFFADIAPDFLRAQSMNPDNPYVQVFTPQAQKERQEELYKQARKEADKFISKDLYDEEAVAKQLLSNMYAGQNITQKAQNGLIATQEDLAAFNTGKQQMLDYMNSEMEDDSVFDEKVDSLIQSGGQLAATAALSAAGVPWYLTTGVTTYGGELENALNQGATSGEARTSAIISAGAEILTEKISGGIKFGGKTLDEGLTKILARSISNKSVRTMAKLGIDMAGEGMEEVLSGVMSAIGQKLTYAKEKELEELFTKEDAWESFIGGAALGGVGSATQAAKGKITGVDPVTELTKNEQAVVDKVYKDAIAEEEKNGTVSQKKKAEIYDRVLEDLEKGYISTDTIEEVLGDRNAYDSLAKESEEYKTLYETESGKLSERQKDRLAELKEKNKANPYDSALQTAKGQLSQDVFNLVKGDRLAESYNEKGRRSQAFEADLSQYDAKQQATIQNAINSGTLNNTRRTHELVDMIAKISADKGVLFDFTNNEKIKGTQFAVEGKIVNGYKTDSGITLNVESPKYLNSTVGHEITHVLEGTEFYDVLKQTVFEYAKSKGEYDSRYADLSELYKGIKNADIEAELTADLVGDYLFQDADFVNKLSTENRNVFQKIYDEIKYLCKVATAGSKEARQLEKVKKAFEDAYRANGKAESGKKYSISAETDKAYTDAVNRGDTETAQKMVDEAARAWSEGNEVYTTDPETGEVLFKFYRSADGGRTVWNGHGNNQSQGVFLTSDPYIADAFDVSLGLPKGQKSGQHITVYAKAENPFEIDAMGQIYTAIPVSEDSSPEWLYEMSDSYIEWSDQVNDYVTVDCVDIDNLYPEAFKRGYDAVIVKNIKEGVGGGVATDVVLKDGGKQMKSADPITYDDSGKVIPLSQRFNTENDDIRYSLSDSDGKQLTKEQQEYFKDSKMRDENGNLKVMYHGSPDAGFHTFDAKMSDDDTSFFFVDSNEVAASYSGTTETYEAQTIKTADDMRKFLQSIGYEDYEVFEEDGKIWVEQDGDYVASGKTGKELYEEFCWYEGIGQGDANYKVYLNLKNPLEVDAEGRNWYEAGKEFSQRLYDNFKSFTEDEKSALKNLAEWEDFGVFKDELAESVIGKSKGTNDAYYNALASAYLKSGFDVNALFDLATADFSEEAMRETALDYLTTRDYAQKAKEQGYDGVIFKNIVDIGGYGGERTPSTVAIAFDSNQIKSVANAKPTADPDIRYSLSEDSEGRKLSENQAKYFKNSKVTDENGNLKVVYHGSPADFNTFSLEYLGTNGTAEGYGFYFTDKKSIAEGYSKGREGQQNGAPGKLFEVYLDIKKPLSDTEVTMSRAQFKKFLTTLNKQVDADGEPLDILSNYGDVAWEGLNNVLNYAMEIEYDGSDSDVNLVHSIINGCGNMETVLDVLRKTTGYDGIIVENATWGDDQKIYLAFHPEQIKNVDNLNPTSDPDIRKSLSNIGEQPKRYGNYNVYAKDILLDKGEVAPVPEVAPVLEAKTPVSATEDLFPDDLAPVDAELDKLLLEKEALESRMLEAVGAEDYDAYSQIDAEYKSVMERIEALEKVATETDADRIGSLGDADAPPEMEAPYPGNRSDAPRDPFADRDWYALGKDRKAKTFMSENPEVKPFFREEATKLLGEWSDTIRAERWYNDDVYYESGGEKGFGGNSRLTSESMAEMLDSWGMSYDAIEQGLEAIINDTGENLASAKRIEFMLNQRLLKGYKDFYTNKRVAPNQGYIDLLKAVQVNADSTEAFTDLVAHGDDYAPMGDFAPVAEEVTEDIAPAYEAIRPQRVRSNEPRMVRADTAEAKGKQRKWVKTSTESEVVNREILPDDLDKTKINYQPISNKKTLGNANAKLDNMGYESSVVYFNSQFSNRKTTLDDIALGERLIQEAMKKGDYKTAGELIQNVAILGTELGQKVQALSIIKRLTPEGQLKMLQKTVARGKTKGDKAYEGVELTQDMIDHILKTYNEDGTFDQAELNKAVEDVKQKIADQMQVTALDKVNAWRYLSMLGNPKTHIRNLVSNVAMKGTVAVKNALARTIEDIAPIKNRTKTWEAATDEVKAFAQRKTAEMKDIISGDSKYSESASIKDKRATFKNKILNGLYEFNSDMLGKEDWWFSKGAFTNSLSEFLTANGIGTQEDIKRNPEIVEKGINYALEQSQIATFRQYSWLANKINEIERKNAATNIAVGAILPFKKTPINIAKTGLNYSPLGFAKTLTYDVSQVKNGNMEASELVDHLAQNVTGSALALVGYMLASAGFLNGAGDDDKEGEYDYQLGKQAYSVTIGDATFSLSWLSPVAMPLFVGANAFEQLVEGKEWNGDVVVETLAQTLDPLSEMSFLSSLDSVLSSYDSGIMKFAGIAETAAQSYIGQFVPTMSSQIATVLDDTKRTTKVAADSEFKFFDEVINNLKYKIPGLRETLEPTTDIWGNEVKQTEDVLERAFETFLAPYAKREDIATAVDKEIKDLYRQTGVGGLIPSVPNNYVNYDGVKYEMSAREFTDFKKMYGQTAYDLLEDLFDTDTYKNADSETRADMVNKVYDYARDEARKTYFAKRGIDFTNATKDGKEVYKENPIKGAIEADMPVDEYVFSEEYPAKYSFFKKNGISYATYAAADEDGKRAYTWAYENPGKFIMSKAVAGDVVTYRKYTGELYDIKADKDSSGKSISGSRKEKVIDYINNMDLDYGQKIILFKSEYNADDTYNYEIIDYLNSREDISYEEMETILKELGFQVSSNGTITWD